VNVLVFSNFSKMLDLFSKIIKENGEESEDENMKYGKYTDP
jgi:hypothetical protein